jgi:small subunit ribosomal protein S8
MSMTDTLADMLTRIRNGQAANLYTITSPHSKLRENVLDVLAREGYIRGYQKIANDNKAELKIELKYVDGIAVIREIQKISKPGRRKYTKVSDLPRFYNGLGIGIVSTPMGVMSDSEARQNNVGGELLCSVF